MTRKKQKPRDTYRYHYWWRGKVVHRGETDNLDRRESEHQVKYPGGHIQQIGPRVTKDTALLWEQKGGRRLQRKK